MGPIRTVVFVCQHGAAKSVLAAALLERLAAEHGTPLRALARGTEPEPQVAPAVAAGLLAKGIDVRAWQPRPLTPGDLSHAWRVVSFGPDLSDLLPAGTVVQVWSDVPAVADDLQAAQTVIAGRLSVLLKDLPEQPAAGGSFVPGWLIPILLSCQEPSTTRKPSHPDPALACASWQRTRSIS
jgi:arsenate reductase (thioredoxin)